MTIEEVELNPTFAKYLPEGWSMVEELAVYALQSEANRQIVQERLSILDKFMDENSDDFGSGDLAAARLGVGRRQLLNLVAKLREFGPTRALTPRFRNVARKSVARVGLETRADQFLCRLLETNPTLRLSKIETELRRWAAAEGIDLPGSSSIRSRVLSLRAKPLSGEDLGPFGHHIFIDQVHLELPISKSDGSAYPILTLILDQETKLIAGHGLMPGFDNGEGISAALDDFRTRITGFAGCRMSVTDEPEITWIVAHRLHYFTHLFEQGELANSVKLNHIDQGTRRHGSAILRLIGDRLPPFSFRPMAMERFDAVFEGPGVDVARGRELVAAAVTRWNRNIFEQHMENVANKIARSNRLKNIEQTVRTAVEPVVQEAKASKEMFKSDTN